MGKSSSSSCLKIIVCGSDAAENDDIHSPEAKTPNDKRGWSFRKKSGRNRVLGNNVSSETTTFADKETPQGGSIDFQSPVKPTSAFEKPQLPRPVEEISKPVATENDSELKTSVVVVTSENDSTWEESKASQKEAAFQSDSNKTSTEYKMVDTSVVSEYDNKETSAECKIADAVVSEHVSRETSVENKIADAVVVSEYDSKETSTGYKMVDSVVVSENDSNETSDESSVASESIVSKEESIKSAEPIQSESGMASENDYDGDNIMNEPVAIIIIQTAMRGFLAQRKFVQLNSAVKLQAVIRGHLVRRNAVETLHCIRAIVKVQGLVRARSSKSLGQKNKPNDSQFSSVKLLENSFARQLLESTPKPKSLSIRCDPMRPNSAWSWLERWMDVSTSEAAEKLEPSVEPEIENEAQKIALEADFEFSPVAFSDSLDSKLSTKEGGKPLEIEENPITDDVTTVNSCSACPLSTEFKIEQSHLQKKDIVNEDLASAQIEASAIEISHTQAEPVPLDDKPATSVTEIQQPKLSMKRSATSELNDEEKKFVYGSRKASNPAFIAAHSKFEELTSAGTSDKLAVSSHQDVEAEPHVNSALSLEESIKKTNKPGVVEASGTFDPRIPVARSECGTELSISSTLDSPDRSDIEIVEAEQEVRSLVETSCLPDIGEKQDCEANGMSSNCITDILSTMTHQGEVHGPDGVLVDLVAAEVTPQVEQIIVTKASDVQTGFTPLSSVTIMESSPVEKRHQENGFNDIKPTMDHQTYKSSPEASPQSHRTVPESQGTPSSQASVKGKKKKIEKLGSNRKRSSPSAEKRSPNKNADSGARSSTENLHKDHKSGKRRNSFGSAKSDNADQEPRDSGSRISLPSYMQATESARAKASSSPRSSPDIHDKEIYSKKRHSLPGATGRQDSPNIQRPAAQSAKANGSHPSNERKWQR
ncbi:hypothetical protein SOVF_130920 [Spinacia oleracea]|uniref:Protein IQ-DOMAIN 32 n=1 Tax=Spinacia oleracea TaxID=3562 RepID=A0A9R0JK12_SPIOL|nr:protein IQ-DOMAIN 32 [Spinacia oleracea]KNA11895.1 hypothetical protein SOVF_130920 [Spinacia oleracea]